MNEVFYIYRLSIRHPSLFFLYFNSLLHPLLNLKRDTTISISFSSTLVEILPSRPSLLAQPRSNQNLITLQLPSLRLSISLVVHSFRYCHLEQFPKTSRRPFLTNLNPSVQNLIALQLPSLTPFSILNRFVCESSSNLSRFTISPQWKNQCAPQEGLRGWIVPRT